MLIESEPGRANVNDLFYCGSWLANWWEASKERFLSTRPHALHSRYTASHIPPSRPNYIWEAELSSPFAPTSYKNEGYEAISKSKSCPWPFVLTFLERIWMSCSLSKWRFSYLTKWSYKSLQSCWLASEPRVLAYFEFVVQSSFDTCHFGVLP